jgi:ketosteroid isomerase-like protein
MKLVRRSTIGGTLLVLFSFCLAYGQQPTVDDSAVHEELVRLNREIFEKVVVGRDAEAFKRFTYDDFLVIPPGGIVEDKEEALAGIDAFRNVTGVTVSDERVAVQGDTAVVIGRVVIHGEVPPMGKIPPVRFLTVFVLQDGQWRMLARSLTPCVPAVIKAGRC